MSGFAIEAEHLSKRFFLGEDASRSRFRQALHAFVPGRRSSKAPDFWALSDVSFSVKQGEAVGIIGRNGAGKSTLLKLLSRITPPTTGTARIRGRVGTLLEVGTGFHPELNGRDNIFLSGTILGMRYAEIARKFDEIVAFAEMEKFIDTPVKRYSSGMYVRLAFAVAAFLDPEILIVDEVLAVGDTGFQRKSLGRLNEASQQQGRTVLFVSHDLQAIRTFCRRVILLEQGRLIFDGPAAEGIERYLRSVPDQVDLRKTGLKDRRNRTSGAVRFTDVTALTADGRPSWHFDSGDTIRLRFSYEVMESVPDLGFLIMLRSAGDERQITTIYEALSDRPLAAGGKATFDLVLPRLPLRPCEVSLYAALGHIDRRSYYDVIDTNVDLPLLIIGSKTEDVHDRQGLVTLDYRIEPVNAAQSARAL